MRSAFYKDGVAITLSAACILHCIALPFIAISSPFLAALAEAEWIHWLMAFLAVLASSIVVISSPSARVIEFLVPAGLGAMLITGALFGEQFGISETIPTVLGGILLASAHIRRIFR